MDDTTDNTDNTDTTNSSTPRPRAKVLVVDDTAANLRLITRMLAEQNFAVLAANSGKLALQFMETTIPDIVLLDVKMPEMDGYEVCRRMKANERTRDIPVIFISALDAAWDKVKAFAVGAVDYLVKPIEAAEVLARLETHISLHNLRRHLEQSVQERTADLLKATADLITNQQLLKSIIDNSNAVIYVKDLEGHYIMVNKRFQDLFGGPGNDLRGLSDYEIFAHDIAKQLRAMDRWVINNATTLETEEVLPHGDERRTYISVKSPLHDVSGQIYAVCGIGTDITERVREQETLRELNEMLESRLAQRLQGSATAPAARNHFSEDAVDRQPPDTGATSTGTA